MSRGNWKRATEVNGRRKWAGKWCNNIIISKIQEIITNKEGIK